MRLVNRAGACDCHSHVYGPFSRYPLSPLRTFDPPEAPIEDLESLWHSLGIERAVLVQGNSYGTDHSALLAALARSPQTRRGIAVLPPTVRDEELAQLHAAGVRGVRFSWMPHLLGTGAATADLNLRELEVFLERIWRYGWHAEFHTAAVGLPTIACLNAPAGMPLVIDHMARLDLSSAELQQLSPLLGLLEREPFWVKLSGADRLAEPCGDLSGAKAVMRQLLRVAPTRCVWGLDWPHVNLLRPRADLELVETLVDAAGDEHTLETILIDNPTRLYGFDPPSIPAEAELTMVGRAGQ